MALIYLTSDGKIIYNSSGKIYLENAAVTIPINGGSLATSDGDVITLSATNEEIMFVLDSGRDTSTFYKWNGNCQQSGFNHIYEYSDLISYEGAELWIYEADYDMLNSGAAFESYFTSHGISPIVVLQIQGNQWVQLQ